VVVLSKVNSLLTKNVLNSFLKKEFFIINEAMNDKNNLDPINANVCIYISPIYATPLITNSIGHLNISFVISEVR
jgi:hypothetical protein